MTEDERAGTPEYEPPYCEVCAEQHATVQLEEIGICDDCLRDKIADALNPVLGFEPCGSVFRTSNGHLSCCLHRAGIEHEHG